MKFIIITIYLICYTPYVLVFSQNYESDGEKMNIKIKKVIKELIPEDMEFVELTVKNAEAYLTVKILKFSPLDKLISNCERHPAMSRPIILKGTEFKWPKIVTLKILINESWMKNSDSELE